MKICSKCKKSLPINSFYLKSRKNNHRRSECKECWNEIVVKNYQRIKKLCIDYKGGKCVLCGYSRCIGALEFHHPDPSIKEFQISSKHRSSFNEKVKLELDKCILLCSNCHREQHC